MADVLTGDALWVEIVGMTKCFGSGSLVALDNIFLKLPPRTFRALLGEDDAGKTTPVKCIMGYQSPDESGVIVGEKECTIKSPKAVYALDLGVGYQHFTLVPNMAVRVLSLNVRAGEIVGVACVSGDGGSW